MSISCKLYIGSCLPLHCTISNQPCLGMTSSPSTVQCVHMFNPIESNKLLLHHHPQSAGYKQFKTEHFPVHLLNLAQKWLTYQVFKTNPFSSSSVIDAHICLHKIVWQIGKMFRSRPACGRLDVDHPTFWIFLQFLLVVVVILFFFSWSS